MVRPNCPASQRMNLNCGTWVSVSTPPTPQAPTVPLRHAQPASSLLRACCPRDVTKGLRRSFEGVTMELRRESVVFPPFFLPSLLPAHPPCHPPFLPPGTLIDPAAPKRLHPFCGADTAPAAPELAIQSASQPGTIFPHEPEFVLAGLAGGTVALRLPCHGRPSPSGVSPTTHKRTRRQSH